MSVQSAKQYVKSLAFILIVFFSGSMFISCGGEEEISVSDKDSLDEYIRDEMDFQNIPAVASLIFKRNEILEEGYYGKSNIEEDLQLSADHLFLLASVSKVITATALLQLYDEGSFKLEDPINDYLPFRVAIPGNSTPITFKMLLTHTSGIGDGPSLDSQYYYGKDSPVSLRFFLENYLVAGGEFYNENENFYDFEPGTSHEYSNIGNALIGLLVEEISGIDFNNYCKVNIFEPLKMNNTFWRLDEINQTIVQPYDDIKGDNKAIGHYTFTDYPNGGLRSTARDMFLFLQAFTQDGLSGDFQLLKSTTIAQMFTPQIPSLDNEVGLHLFIMDKKNNLWGHDGGEQGVATIMAFQPETGVGVILLTNQGEAELEDMLQTIYEYGVTL